MFQKIFPRHFRRYGQPHTSEQRRRNVAKFAVADKGCVALVGVYEDKRHGIGRVRGMDVAVFVQHFFGVSMVCRNENITAVVNDKNMLASFNVNEPMDISGSLEWGLIKGTAKIAASWKQDVKFAY